MRGTIDNISAWQVVKPEINETNFWLCYDLNGHTVEKMIPLQLAVELYRECKLHIITVDCENFLHLTDYEIEDVLLSISDDDSDWIEIVNKIEELKKVPTWKKLLRSL